MKKGLPNRKPMSTPLHGISGLVYTDQVKASSLNLLEFQFTPNDDTDWKKDVEELLLGSRGWTESQICIPFTS